MKLTLVYLLVVALVAKTVLGFCGDGEMVSDYPGTNCPAPGRSEFDEEAGMDLCCVPEDAGCPEGTWDTNEDPEVCDQGLAFGAQCCDFDDL